MLSVIGFLIILGPLVVFHEFGHYIFARIFGVKAEVFSVGFGPRIWSKQMGETELRVSIIPLGGYVKLLGEDRDAPLPPEEAKRALHKQEPWKRFFIFFGGPLFNFILATLVFMAILVIGEPQPANVVGRVVRGSQAAQAGFKSGDRINSVQGKPVSKYEEILTVIRENPSKPLEFDVTHSGSPSPQKITVTPTSEKGYSIYGESTAVGEIDGISAYGRGLEAGVSDPSSVAASVGIKTGDRITEVNGTALKSWEELEDLFAQAPIGAKIKLRVQKPSGTEEKLIELTKPVDKQAASQLVLVPSVNQAHAPMDMQSAWGLFSSELFVDKAMEDSPAAKAGVTHGDRLIGVGDKPVQSFVDLRDAVQFAGDATGTVQLNWEREGKVHSEKITPTATKTKDPEMKSKTQYTVGVAPMMTFAEPVTVIEKVYNPFNLVWMGTSRMITFTWRNFVSIVKMFKGEVSVGTLGGPILIGKIAGESLSHGLVTFLTTMAILSIGLGVLNLLPVPVLDGGHIVLLGLESLRGKPLTLRQAEIIQGVGLALILALMGVVIKNDITRLVSF
jgi:regulator of sigma E protease